MHNLKLTNNGAILIFQILSSPDIFSTPLELLRAGKLMERLETTPVSSQITPGTTEFDYWMKGDFGDLTLSETERNIIRQAITKMISKIPASPLTSNILTQLGFDE